MVTGNSFGQAAVAARGCLGDCRRDQWAKATWGCEGTESTEPEGSTRMSLEA